MTNNTKYIFGASWAALGGIVGMIASMVTTIFAVRMLTKEEIGAYFLVLLVTEIVVIVGSCGLRNTVIKFLSQLSKNDNGSTINFLFSANIIASFFSAILLILVMPVLERTWPYESFLTVSWYAVPIALFAINYLFLSSFLAGVSKFRAMSKINACIEVFRMILSLVLIFSGFGVTGLLVSMVVSRILGICLIWYVIPVKPRLLLNGYLGHMSILRFSGWVYGASILSFLSVRTSDFILAKLLGPSSLAVLTISRQVPSMVQKLFESIRPVLLSFTSSRKYSSEQLVIQELRLISGVLTVISMCLILLADPIIVLLYSTEYKESVDIMRVFSAWVVLHLVNYYIVIYLTGRGFGEKLLFLTIPQAILAPLLTILLIPVYEEIGVPFALMITGIVGNLLGCWFVAEGRVSFFIKLNYVIAKSTLPLMGLLLWVLSSENTVGLFVLQGISCMLILLLTGAVSVTDIKNVVKQVITKK